MTVYKLRRRTPPPNADPGAYKFAFFVRAYDELAKTGRWGDGGWWQPYPQAEIGSVSQHIETRGFEIVRRFGSPFRAGRNSTGGRT